MQQVKLAARAASADEFIEKLPQKYDTEIGERGVKLSGGQKQRIAIARVFLKNPPLLCWMKLRRRLTTRPKSRYKSALEKLAEGRTTNCYCPQADYRAERR